MVAFSSAFDQAQRSAPASKAKACGSDRVALRSGSKESVK